MSRFQRMIVLPQEEYSQLMSVQKLVHPYAQPYQQLQSRLDEQSHIHDPYSRFMHETDTRNQMNLIQDNIKNVLLATVPKVYKSRAESLLKVVQPYLKLTERGEIIDPHTGMTVENTRVDDLIQYAVSAKRRGFVPRGWTEFVRHLRKINVPTSILNRETVEELQEPERGRPLQRGRVMKRERPRFLSHTPIRQKRKIKESTRYPKEKFLKYYT